MCWTPRRRWRLKAKAKQETEQIAPFGRGSAGGIHQKNPVWGLIEPAMYDGRTALNHPFARTLYIIEFFVALLAIFTMWSQVGGQNHLDLMPWYLKLVLVVGAAAAAVKATAAGAFRGTILWIVVVVLLAAIMGLLTYYYHLTEAADEEESQEIALLSLESRRDGAAPVFRTYSAGGWGWRAAPRGGHPAA
jgi:hypothetical protein